MWSRNPRSSKSTPEARPQWPPLQELHATSKLIAAFGVSLSIYISRLLSVPAFVKTVSRDNLYAWSCILGVASDGRKEGRKGERSQAMRIQ